MIKNINLKKNSNKKSIFNENIKNAILYCKLTLQMLIKLKIRERKQNNK